MALPAAAPEGLVVSQADGRLGREMTKVGSQPREFVGGRAGS